MKPVITFTNNTYMTHCKPSFNKDGIFGVIQLIRQM